MMGKKAYSDVEKMKKGEVSLNALAAAMARAKAPDRLRSMVFRLALAGMAEFNDVSGNVRRFGETILRGTCGDLQISRTEIFRFLSQTTCLRDLGPNLS